MKIRDCTADSDNRYKFYRSPVKAADNPHTWNRLDVGGTVSLNSESSRKFRQLHQQ